MIVFNLRTIAPVRLHVAIMCGELGIHVLAGNLFVVANCVILLICEV